MSKKLMPSSSARRMSGRLAASGSVQGWSVQERALGGLKPATCRLLDRVADDAAARCPVKAMTTARKLGAGAVLVRQWGGVDHEVTVLEEGVLFRGKRHRSLSEVARVITGSRWSGPLFFGLKAPAKEMSANGGR